MNLDLGAIMHEGIGGRTLHNILEQHCNNVKKFPKTKSIGRRGVAFVEGIVSDAGSIFREIPEETDVGIDGYIEFVEKEIVTGTLVAVQIKTGPSYTKQRKSGLFFEVTLSKNDVNYLHIHQLPTAVIFYEPESNLSGWLDVTGYLRSDQALLEKESVKLALRCGDKPFNPQTFQKEFKQVFQDYRIEVDRSHFVELMASQDPNRKYLGFLG